ncbi:MAG: hypothetical protein FWJ70_08205 [Micromonosporaceae bacterium]|jgi:hypothetical protein
MKPRPRPTVSTLLATLFRDRPRLTRAEIQERAARLDLPDPLRATVDALPEGEYDLPRADATMRRIQREEGYWRNHSRLPLAELDRALATYAADGQVDDLGGGDASAEVAEFADQPWPGPTAEGEEPDPDSEEGRRLRPSPEGRTGPA